MSEAPISAADAFLARLLAAHRHVETAINLKNTEADEGKEREAELEQLWSASGALVGMAVATHAESLVGAAIKLVMWRADALLSSDDGVYEMRDAFVFSAYRDLLRLAQLTQLADPRDQETMRRVLTTRWI